MEEQFADFLSDELLEFCSYDSHENNLAPSAISCNELDAALTMLTKQGVEVFAQPSEDYCSTNNSSNLESKTNTLTHISKLIQISAMPKSDNEVWEAQKVGVLFKTRKYTEWCFSIWEEWQSYRRETTKTMWMIPPIEPLGKVMLDYWLSQFILEVKKKGDPPSKFPLNTLYHIFCGIHYLRYDDKPHISFSLTSIFPRSTVH